MLIEAKHSSLLIIDVQEKLLPVVAEADATLKNCEVLLEAATALQLPVTVSEQYPQGLGPTVEPLLRHTPQPFAKLHFSAWRDGAIKHQLIELHEGGRPQIILCGLEAHICVLQTALDLHAAGFCVFVVEDAVSSRKSHSKDIAMARLRAEAVSVATMEMVLFELLQQAGTAEFKHFSKLIR